MKTKRSLLYILLFLQITIITKAQTDVDALRYSGSSITGTARFSAMGGAFGALGGDFTSLSYNPAGIAVYRSSEFTFTPSVFSAATTSSFLGQSFEERKYNFNIGNIGLVYTGKISKDDNTEGWKSWNFGIGYNRLDNFHSRSFYEGTNPSSSLLDNFAENANGSGYSDLDPFFESLAYYNYLINPDSADHYTSAFSNGQIFQRRSSETVGCIGETVFSFGGNYSNKYFLGATLGFKNLRFIESSTYEEQDKDKINDTLDHYKFEQDITTKGVGFDLKVGFIYRPNDLIRLGVSVQTPTWYTLHDDYKNKMSAKFDGGDSESSESPDGEYDYDLSTPFNAIGSIAFIFGKVGLLSADYQFSNVADARFDASTESFSDVNNIIRRKYCEVHTLRVGTEWFYQNVFIRGGFSMNSTPMNKIYTSGTSDFSKKSFSGGIGFREKHMFFDLGYVHSVSDQFYQPYNLENEEVPGVKSRISTNNFVATLGVKF